MRQSRYNETASLSQRKNGTGRLSNDTTIGGGSYRSLGNRRVLADETRVRANGEDLGSRVARSDLRRQETRHVVGLHLLESRSRAPQFGLFIRVSREGNPNRRLD
jgi:hypothetical protein